MMSVMIRWGKKKKKKRGEREERKTSGSTKYGKWTSGEKMKDGEKSQGRMEEKMWQNEIFVLFYPLEYIQTKREKREERRKRGRGWRKVESDIKVEWGRDPNYDAWDALPWIHDTILVVLVTLSFFSRSLSLALLSEKEWNIKREREERVREEKRRK